MIKRRDVFLKVCGEHSRFVTCYVEHSYANNWQEQIRLSTYKMAPEEVIILVRAAKKYYDLVVL